MATIAQLIVDVAANTARLQEDVNKVNKSLQTIQDAAGTAGKALAGLFGIVSVGATAKQLLDYADGVVNVAEKTKFSTDAVQELTLAFQPHGIAIDAVATANEKLSKNLIGDDKSTVAALQKMGLHIATLKTLAPDQLFITVADAVGKIKNPAEQAYVAMTVFGKGGAEILGALDGHLKETTESFKAMGLIIDEKTIKAADDFGDQLGLMGKQLLGIVAQIIGPLLPGLSALGSALSWLAGLIGTILHGAILGLEAGFGSLMATGARVVAWLADLITKVPVVGKHLGFMGDAANILRGFADGTSDAVHHLFDNTDQLGQSAPKTGGALRGFGGDLEEAARKAKEFKEAMERIASFGVNYQTVLATMDGQTVAIGVHLLEQGAKAEDLRIVLGLTEGQVKALEQQHKFLASAIESTNKQMVAQHQILGLMRPRFSDLHDELTGVEEQTGLLHAELLDINDTAIMPFADAEKYAAEQTDALRDKLEELRDTPSIFQRLMNSVGGLNDIFQRAFEGGGDLGGAVSSFATHIASNLLSAIPVVGPMISQFAGSIVSGIKRLFGGPSQDELAARDTFAKFQQQFGSLQQTIDAVGAAYVKAGKTGTDAQRDLQRALDATHKSAAAEAEALQTINDVLNQQKQDEADLQAAVERYHFSIEELGPAMQKQQLDAQAQQLIRDWTLLVDSGIKVDAVNARMSDSMNSYLQLARSTGQEVPAAMEPILQKMLDQGLLTDDAGKKITDLKDLGVTFSMTMSEGFQKVVDKLQELLEKIGGVATGINNIPKDVTITTRYTDYHQDVTLPPIYTDTDSGAYGSTGGLVTSTGIQHFAGGGTVLPFVPRGTDTVPAMLTPGEMVLTKNQQQGLGSTVVDLSEVRQELQQLRREQATQARRLPQQLTAAFTSAMTQSRQGRR